MRRLGVLATVLVALVAASATVGAERAEASNPVYALRLSQEAYRLSNQIVALAGAGQRSNSLPRMCGYYVPQITVRVRRLRQIVRLLYVYAPSGMRWRVDSVSRTVGRLRTMSTKMNNLCLLYG